MSRAAFSRGHGLAAAILGARASRPPGAEASHWTSSFTCERAVGRAAAVLVGWAALISSLQAADAPWAIADAPYRAVIHAGRDSGSLECGYAIDLPEFGQTMANLADVVLTDAKGQPVPIAKAWHGEGQKALLLAQTLPVGDCYLYFGGNRPRRQTAWTPKISLLLETRRLPAGTKLADWPDLEAAWKKSGEADGAGFVGAIEHGENPFGDDANFMSHYSGWLRTDGKRLTLFTLSSDASFVLVGGRFAFGWPGEHAARANAKTAPQKEIDTTGNATQIDYYQAKAADTPATMVLGWSKNSQMETIPASGWMHPGATDIVRVEQAQGGPVPLADIQVHSYMGWNGLWLYDTECKLRGGLPAGWAADWEFDDGAKFTGAQCERVIPGPGARTVRVRLTRGKDEVRGVRRIEFAGKVRDVKTDETGPRNHYLQLLDKETPETLSAETLKAGFEFLNEFGTDEEIGRYATAWMAKTPDLKDPLWISGEIARLRSLAQSNPQQALTEIRRIDNATRTRYGKELGMEELEILVFYLKDPAAVQIAGRLAFENANSDAGRLAKIRIGDLYRLLGKTTQAVEQYQSVQKTISDETQGRKNAAEDRSNSITITDLIEGGYRHEAEQKVREWELAHPMAKYDSDFLLIRGRVLMLFGRWNEALQEIESFQQMQPDSPYQIPADFYRARALFELGKKDEARKIWADLAAKYPKHELAGESRRLSTQK